MTVVGLLVEGPQGEEYLVRGGAEGGLGTARFQLLRRELLGWTAASLPTDVEARLRTVAMIALDKMVRQFGIGGSGSQKG
jgi:hypothetical protein